MSATKELTATDCRRFAQRVRLLASSGQTEFGSDFLEQLADDCETIAESLEG